MKINNLYIIGEGKIESISEISEKSKVVFLDKKLIGLSNELELIKILEKKQNFLREKWLNFQEQVFKKLKIQIDKDKDFYYVLCNLFFEASPLKTDSVYKFFKLYLLLDYVKKEKIKNIFLHNVSKEIEDFFYINMNLFSFSVNITSTLKKNQSLIKLLKKSEKENVIFSLLSGFIQEYKKKKQKILYKKSKSNKVVLSYYIPGANKFDNGFSNNFFDDVSALLNKDYNWLFIYEGHGSNFDYENKLISKNINSLGFLDSYLSFMDFSKIIPKFFRVRKKLKSIKYNDLFVFEDVNYSCLIKSDWFTSISILLFKLLIFEKKFSNFIKLNPQVKEIIYLLEFQPWEQILNKIAQKHKIKTKGVIHSIARPNVMSYYHPKLLHSYFYLPNQVGVNSDFSKSLLLTNGFSKDQLLEIEAHRFNYLAEQSEISYKKINSKKSILIITSVSLKENIELLETFSQSNVKFENIYIKEHFLFPVSSIIKSSIKNFPSYKVINCSVLEAFKFSDIVYSANGSSVLMEAVVKKKPTVSLISLASLPIPAIEKSENLHFVYDVKSLSNILRQLNLNLFNHALPDNEKEYLYLDKELKLWKEFLNK